MGGWGGGWGGGGRRKINFFFFSTFWNITVGGFVNQLIKKILPLPVKVSGKLHSSEQQAETNE